VGKQSFHLEAVPERDVDDRANRGRTIGIDRLPGDELEEFTAEAVPAKWRDLDALGMGS
jgi:hypothetical protein